MIKHLGFIFVLYQVAAEKIEQLVARELIMKAEIRQLRERHDVELVDLRRQHLSELDQLGLERDSLIRAVEDLRQAVLEKDDALETLRGQLAEESERWELQERHLSEKMESMKLELEEKKQEILSLASESEKKESSGNATLNSTGGSDEAVANYQRHLETMEEMESLQDTVAAQQAEIEELQNNIAARDEELLRLQSKIVDLESAMAGFADSRVTLPEVSGGDDRPAVAAAEHDVQESCDLLALQTKMLHDSESQLSEKIALLGAIEEALSELDSRSSSQVDGFEIVHEVRMAVAEAVAGRRHKAEVDNKQQEIEDLKLRLVEHPSVEQLQEEIQQLKDRLEKETDMQKDELFRQKQVRLMITSSTAWYLSAKCFSGVLKYVSSCQSIVTDFKTLRFPWLETLKYR